MAERSPGPAHHSSRHPQILDNCFPLDLMFSENDPWVLEGFPVRDEQSLGLLQRSFSGLCYPTNALSATDFYWSLAPGFWRLQQHTRQMRHPRSRWCSFQQVGPSAGNRLTWRSKQVVWPVTPEERHMSSLLWETICRPHISPACRLDSHLSSATGSLESALAPSSRRRCSISRYWTHCVCQCWSMRIIPYAYQCAQIGCRRSHNDRSTYCSCDHLKTSKINFQKNFMPMNVPKLNSYILPYSNSHTSYQFCTFKKFSVRDIFSIKKR